MVDSRVGVLSIRHLWGTGSCESFCSLNLKVLLVLRALW
jgi:hypothetical protein